MPLLELNEIVCIAQVESKSHRWIQSVKLELLGLLLVVLRVVRLQEFNVLCLLRRVWVKQDQAFLLHADEVVGFFRAAADDAAVELASIEGLHWGEVLALHLPQPKAIRDENEHAVPPFGLLRLRLRRFSPLIVVEEKLIVFLLVCSLLG